MAGTNPTVFAKFAITPASPRDINAVIRIKRDSMVITTQNISVALSGNTLSVRDITVSERILEPRSDGTPPKIKKGQYEFKWEISFNNGQSWKSIGDSGDHRIHWIVGNPINHTILNSNARELENGQVQCIDQNRPCEWNKLYDVALKNSTEKLGGGETDLNKIAEKINKELAGKIPYQPQLEPTEDNPLKIITENDGAVCWDNALLLRGLLRSIGISPSIKFYYGGKNGYRHFFFYYPDGPPCPPNGDCRATMRLSRGDLCRLPNECVDADPHFSYHATVDFLNKKYDPSYGEVDKPIKMQEALDIIQEQGQPPRGRLVTGNAAQLFLYEANTFEGVGYDLGIACRHRRNSFAHAGKRLFSFDNDSVTDLSIARPSTSEWMITNSFDGSTTTLSQAFNPQEDLIVPGDYDGDGKVDAAVWRFSGLWNIINSSDGSNRTEYLMPLNAGEKPVPSDYDGDSKTDIAGWIPDDGRWVIIRSSDNSRIEYLWGLSTDIPVPGDYDGDRKTDLAIWRPSEGKWYVLSSESSSWIVRQWGMLGDTPVPNDYDGDSVTDFAVVRPSTGVWYILESSNDYAWRVYQGEPLIAGDMPVPSDYDGDSSADAAIWRSSDSTWRIIRSLDGTFEIRQWGNSTLGDIPVPSAYVFR
jgi:hypothetical protein